MTLTSIFSTPDLDRDPLVKGKQVVEIKHTLKEPRSLADSVLTTGHTKELHLRDTRWKQANGELKKISPNLHVFCHFHKIYRSKSIDNRICKGDIHTPNIVHLP